MNRWITMWPTAVEAQDRCDVLGRAHVVPNGTAFLAVPDELDTSAAQLIANVGRGARNTDPDTSHTAAAADRTIDRERALAIHEQHPDGLTDDELAVLMERRPTSAGKRRLELERDGLIVRTSQRRPTRAGSPALVFKIATRSDRGAA